MKPEQASKISDALARSGHPRLDYRTAEARRYTERLRPFLKKLVFPGCRALDLGCGAGKFTFELEQLGAHATGLDCSREAIELARGIAASMDSHAEFRLGTFDKLPFLEESFDLVIFPQNIIECSYKEMDSIAQQLKGILSPAGRLCLEMQDGLERCRESESDRPLDVARGSRQRTIDIPDEGEFPYETTFWTVGFARFVISRHLRFLGMEREEDKKRYILNFARQPVDRAI